MESDDGTLRKKSKSKYLRFQKFGPERNIVAKCFMRNLSAITQKLLTPLVKVVPRVAWYHKFIRRK